MQMSYWTRTGRALSLVAGMLLLVVAGCGDDSKRPIDGTPGGLRIVSLSPSVSKILVDLDLGPNIVGRNSIDPVLNPSIPVVAEFGDIRLERISGVRPTHIVGEFSGGEAPAALEAYADSQGVMLLSYPSPSSLKDLDAMIFDAGEMVNMQENPPYSLGVFFNRNQEGLQLEMQLMDTGTRLRDVVSKANKLPPKVLVVYAVNPLQGSGPGTVHGDVVERWLRAENVLGDEATSAVTLSTEKIRKLAPDAVIMLLPDARPLGSVEDDERLAVFRGLDIPAVRDGRIGAVTHRLAQLPSTSITEVGVEMAKIVYPDLSEQFDETIRRMHEEAKLQAMPDGEATTEAESAATTDGGE